MGWNLKKKFKRFAGNVKDVAKKAVDVQMKLYTGGQYGADEAKGVYQDVTGKTAADEAKRATQQQQALIAEQDAKIQAEQDKLDKVADERRERLKKRQLLSGGERGVKATATSSGLLSGAR